jgi:hypothetical protein
MNQHDVSNALTTKIEFGYPKQGTPTSHVFRGVKSKVVVWKHFDVIKQLVYCVAVVFVVHFKPIDELWGEFLSKYYVGALQQISSVHKELGLDVPDVVQIKIKNNQWYDVRK